MGKPEEGQSVARAFTCASHAEIVGKLATNAALLEVTRESQERMEGKIDTYIAESAAQNGDIKSLATNVKCLFEKERRRFKIWAALVIGSAVGVGGVLLQILSKVFKWG